MKYSVERHDIDLSGLYTQWGDRIEADSIEEAKIKAKDLFLIKKREILGDLFESLEPGSNDKIYAFIASSDRKLRNSGIIIFV